jgi:branched-chain amino acid transport system substrate-binding protein
MGQRLLAVIVLLGMLAAAHDGMARETVRIGIIGPFSGPFALQGTQFKQGIEAYRGLYGATAGDRDVEFIYRDVGGTNPAEAKRLAEELIVRNKVSLLGGFFLSPEASAAASVVTETKTPAVLFVAGALPIIRLSPYFVRAGSATATVYVTQAEWAIKRGLKRAYIAVADYAPGYDAQRAFKSRFTELGGQIIGEDRMPLSTVDYAAFAERIANAHPDVISVFVPDGSPTVSFVNALTARGFLRDKKTTMLGNAEWDDPVLHLFGDSVLGFYSVIPYAIGLPNDENKKFKAFISSHYGPQTVPNYAAVDAFDGTHLLYRMIEAQGPGAFDPEVAMRAVRGFKWQSPRGEVEIDAATRDVIQNMYVRRVEQVDGHKENVVVDTFTAVKPPAALKP